jgi:RNA polymerase sigma-70 factor (ECF subfamily)
LVKRREQLAQEFDRRFVHLSSCLQKLPSEQRGIIEAYYYRAQPVDEIAAGSGRTGEAIYKVLQRIRHALRQCIDREIALEGGS